MSFPFLFPTLFALAAAACGMSKADSLTTLSPLEQDDVDATITDFYTRTDDASVMNSYSPKFSLNSQKYVSPNGFLRLKGEQPSDPLLKLAQVKATPEFEKFYCETFLRKHFPNIPCGRAVEHHLSAIQSDDQAEDLAKTWTHVSHDLDEIPVEGKSDQPLWSDDYWRVQWGITSFRYSGYDENNEFKNYTEAINSYRQPEEWVSALDLSPKALSKRVLDWSPAEKYDLTVGDAEFTLTNEQKNEGQSSIGKNGDVEDWMGICHGWAPAAIMVERPEKHAKVIGTKGVEVDWYPNDIKAMVSLAWANGNYPVNNAGGRCERQEAQDLQERSAD